LGRRRAVSILDTVDLPKGTIGELKFTGESSRKLPVLPDGKPVSEFVIFDAGANDSDYGPIEFDAIAAAFILSNDEDKGNPLQFDFNHGMAKQYATAEEGKSAGTFEIAVRDGALWAVNCQWTKEAYARIEAREYNLFSPWFTYITGDDGVCRPYKLYNVAILNMAGLNGITQLAVAAASAAIQDQENSMTPEEQKRLQDRVATLETENATLRAAAAEVVQIGHSLALGANTGPTERTAAVSGLLMLRRDVHKLVGQTTDAGALGAIEALKDKAAKAEDLEARQLKLESDAIAAELNLVLDDAVKAGKVSPGTREIFQEAALGKGGGKPSTEGVAYLRARLEGLPKLVSTTETSQKQQSAETTPAARGIAVQMGVNMADFELFKTDRAAWEAKIRDRNKPAAASR
jgi:phage I-like protein